MGFGPRTPEIDIINRVRKHLDLPPIPSDAELNEHLQREGFTHCEEKPYWWASDSRQA